MTILVATNEVGMTIPGGTTPGGTNDVRFDKTTTSDRYDPDYSRANIKHPTGLACTWDFFSTPARDDIRQLWVHFASYGTSSQDVDYLWIRDTGGTKVFAVRKDCGISTCDLRAVAYNDAEDETQVSQSVGAIVGIQQYDVCFDFPTEKVFFYKNSIFQGSVDLALDLRTGNPVLKDIEFDGSTASDNFGFSELIVTIDEPTLGWRVKDINPDGAGNYSAWTGSHTDVNENLYDPTTENTIVGAGSQSYTYDDVQAGIQTGQEVKGIVVATVAAADAAATAPSVQNFVRTNATDYNLGSPVNVEGADNRSAIVDFITTNPDTGAKWTFSEINAAEFGFTSS